MVNDAVKIEQMFINDSLNCSLIGMNCDLMTQYIKYVADILLLNLGYTKLYNTQNPFDFMENLSLQIKSNFFETKTTSYQKASAVNNNTTIIEDF